MATSRASAVNGARQRAADVLRHVATIGQDGPRVSLDVLRSFPTTEFWLRPGNGIDVSAGHENPLVTGELGEEDFKVSDAASGGKRRVGGAVLEQIDLINLVEAKRAFVVRSDTSSGADGDEPAMGALSLGAFTRALANVCNVPQHELAHLFMKIDHNSDGLVSWDEFLSYVVQSDKGHEASRLMEGAQARFEPQPRPPGQREANAHRERIGKVLYIANRNHYITASNDGSVRFWDGTTLQHVHTAYNGPSWINDMAHLPDVSTNKLAVAAADRTIAFYEMSVADPKRKYVLYGRMLLPSLPLCLAAWLQGPALPVLGCGDDTGCVHVYDARALVQLVARSGEGRKPLDSTHSRRARLYTLKLHSDWVSSIAHVERLHALLTSGLDATIKLTDLTRQLDTNDDGVLDATEVATLHTLCGHTKGIHALASLAVGGRELGVSAALDRRVVVWNLETGDEVAELEGHRNCVQQVCADESLERLITLASDCEVRVWDLATFACVQVISPLGNEPLAQCGAIYFNKQHQCLVTAARELTLWQPRKFFVPIDVIRATSLGPRGHKVPLVAVLYSTLYHLALSADESSIICVWDVHSGAQLFRFEHHGARLTTMAFDASGRRLITGADDGALRLYNFSSGELLRTYSMLTGGALGEARRDELTAVLHIHEGAQEIMCAGGWSHAVWLWYEEQQSGSPAALPAAAMSASSRASRTRTQILTGHRADILCLGYVPPTWLVSGAYDGEVLVWDVLHGDLKRRLVPAHRPLPALSTLKSTLRARGKSRARASGGLRGKPDYKPDIRPAAAVSATPASAGVALPPSDDELRLSASIERIVFLNPPDDGAHGAHGAHGSPARSPGAPSRPHAGSGGGLARARAASPLIVAISADGGLSFWHLLSGQLVLELEGACEANESLTALAKEETNCFLVTGDSAGYVRLWDVAQLAEYAGRLPTLFDAASAAHTPPPADSARLLLTWRAHARSVIAAEYLTGISGFLTAGADCTVRIWSIAGEQIGVFGQHAPWDLAERGTWLDAEPAEVGVPSRHKDLPSAEVPLTDIFPPPVLASLVAALSGRRHALFRNQRAGAQGPSHRELKAMHEQTKLLRPGSARALALLEPSAAKFRHGKAAHRLPSGANGGGGKHRRLPSAPPSAHAVVISPEALRMHSTDVFREVLPPIRPSGSLLESSWTSPHASPRGSASPERSRLGALSLTDQSGFSARFDQRFEASPSFHPARMWVPSKARLHAPAHAGAGSGSPSAPQLPAPSISPLT